LRLPHAARIFALNGKRWTVYTFDSRKDEDWSTLSAPGGIGAEIQTWAAELLVHGGPYDRHVMNEASSLLERSSTYILSLAYCESSLVGVLVASLMSRLGRGRRRTWTVRLLGVHQGRTPQDVWRGQGIAQILYDEMQLAYLAPGDAMQVVLEFCMREAGSFWKRQGFTQPHRKRDPQDVLVQLEGTVQTAESIWDRRLDKLSPYRWQRSAGVDRPRCGL